jgi:cytochrome c2
MRRGRGLILAGLLVAIGLSLAASLYLAYGPEPKTPVSTSTTIINSALYNLDVRFYEGRIPKPAVPGGGGLALIGDRYLLATGDGHLYLFGWRGSDEELVVTALPYRIPINGEEFAAAVGLPYARPRETIATATGGESTGPQVDTWRFRVSDILLQQQGEKLRLFAGHHYWNNAQRCFIVRVSMAESDRAEFMNGTAKLVWKTLYDAKPCLPIEGDLRERASPFEGNLSGGRLALRDPDTLLFTVGFHGFDGVNSKQLYSQDPEASWGTTVLIHVNEGSSETFATGLRNEQGLYIDPKGGIWETEHGPRGGDELNYLEQGVNYGWPYVTYGTDYTSLVWPLSKTQGRHDGYREPVFAWVPSIGVSQLIGIEKDLFPEWKGDLLVSSLRAESLFRMHIIDRRVVLAEPIPIKRRIRTLLEGHDGRIILWTEDAAIVSIKPATGTNRQLLFATVCGGCHKVEGGTNLIGPDLLHVYGRKVASEENFREYSPALKKVSGKWDEEKLDKFLTNPQAMVPGTAMPFQGIADPGERAAIIGYLKSIRNDTVVLP